MNNGKQIAYLLCGFLLGTVSGDICVYKECDCDGTSIDCISLGLKSIPQKIDTNGSVFDYLDLNVNMITTIHTGSLPPNLTGLSLDSNPITSIDDTAFDESATTLETISFSYVLFTKLPDAISHLKQLKSFSIYHSNIIDWNGDIMKNFGKSLQTLYLENCGIIVWPSWMQYMTNLNDVSLFGNFLSSVPDGAMDKLSNSLTSLSLVNNSLTQVPLTLSNLSALTMLYLDENKISSVEFLPKTSKLMELSLSYNRISNADQLSQALVPYADSLKHILIESNRLIAIPNLSFLRKIRSLDFTNNLISDPNVGTLPPKLDTLHLESNSLQLIPKVMMSLKSVTYLIISSNEIRNIYADSFPPWIVGAELGHNLITDLTDTSFPVNSSVRFLHLNNNPIVHISDQAFRNLPLLHELTLQYTKLTRLPLGLASASKLSSIDLSGSSDLVCTCLEKNLRSWVVNMQQNSVNGDCGQTSIYNFL